jgi:hypothetical protein
VHYYISAACQHDQHEQCDLGCQLCGAECLCLCHRAADEVIPKLDEALVLLRKITRQEVIVSKELDELTKQVAANRDVTQSAITLIAGIKARLDEAGTDPAKLQALRDDLAAQDQALAEAVAANTPAA